MKVMEGQYNQDRRWNEIEGLKMSEESGYIPVAKHGIKWTSFLGRFLLEVHMVEEKVAVLDTFKYMQVVCRRRV